MLILTTPPKTTLSYNEESGSNHYCLHLHVQVHGNCSGDQIPLTLTVAKANELN